VLTGIHDGLPAGAFLELAVADHAVGVETRALAAGDGKALGNSEALAHGAGGDVNAGKDGARMAVEQALVRARIVQEFLVKVTELGVDGCERGDGVSFTEGEDILAATGGVGDVEPDEAAVEERDEREDGGERSA